MTKGTVLVSSPSAIGRQPDASGSSVPAWPARLHENSRLMAPTACVGVMPTALSSTIQPCTSCFGRRNCCVFFFPSPGCGLSFPSPACGGGVGRGLSGGEEAPPPPPRLACGPPPRGGGGERRGET